VRVAGESWPRRRARIKAARPRVRQGQNADGGGGRWRCPARVAERGRTGQKFDVLPLARRFRGLGLHRLVGGKRRP
jgi:hypothetical protein